jgi:hypothetical protein
MTASEIAVSTAVPRRRRRTGRSMVSAAALWRLGMA